MTFGTVMLVLLRTKAVGRLRAVTYQMIPVPASKTRERNIRFTKDLSEDILELTCIMAGRGVVNVIISRGRMCDLPDLPKFSTFFLPSRLEDFGIVTFADCVECTDVAFL